jgi:uncharacterized cupin superfamily protein
MATVVKRNFGSPDEEISPGRGSVAIIRAGDTTFKRVIFNPGWRWTEDIGPQADTELCPVPHCFAHISGKLHIKMKDGQEYEFGPGDVSVIPPGHDAWVDGSEPVVIIDQTPAEAPPGS